MNCFEIKLPYHGSALMLALFCACLFACDVRGEETPLAESASACVFVADTLPAPKNVKTSQSLAELVDGTWKIAWRKGETVVKVSPDGVETELSDGSSAGSSAIAIDAGGVWTFRSSRWGTAVFAVRRSIDDTLGDGTLASPAKLVDGNELIDYGATSGYVFRLEHLDGLLARVRIPAGACLEAVDSETWRIVASADGSQYMCGDIAYACDSKGLGPDRRTKRKEALPIAYTGDNWNYGATKPSVLTIISPEGQESVANCLGTGAYPFRFDKLGLWTVRLDADGSTSSAAITIMPNGIVMGFH